MAEGAQGAGPLLLAKVAVAGVVFGLAGLLFAEVNHRLGGWCKRFITYAPLRPVAGGLAVIAWSPCAAPATISGSAYGRPIRTP